LKINYNNKVFKAISNSDGGEVDEQTRFYYYQKDEILWATYSGTVIKFGTITGIVSERGELDFRYQHVNQNLEIKTGRCRSTPTIMENGKIRLHESWQWTDTDDSQGESIIEEV